ncbi:Rad9/Ddc1, partial [Schizophyllum commune]
MLSGCTHIAQILSCLADLKARFTKALFCLSKYGEELSLQATNDTLSLSATNSAKSAYCRLKYDKQFFSRYNIARPPDQPLDYEPEVLGQLTARSLLSILKHRTVEKTVERCEFSIVDGDHQEDAGEDHDALESKLIIKLYCKHGIVKTHRVLMLTPTSMLAPSMPDAALESRLTIGPRGLKYIIEHFPMPRGAKSDPSLIWNFGDADVEVKSLESSLDPKAHGQVMTEMTISVEEFDIYDIVDLPTTISFHLREFNSTIAFAESMGLPLDLHFTDPAAPLFIDIEGDCFDSLFVISTSTVPGSMASQRSGASQQRSGSVANGQR